MGSAWRKEERDDRFTEKREKREKDISPSSCKNGCNCSSWQGSAFGKMRRRRRSGLGIIHDGLATGTARGRARAGWRR